MSIFKKLLISFLIGAIFLTNFAAAAHAQSTSWYNQSYKEWNAKVFDSPDNEIFGERYTFAQVQWIVYSLSAIMTGSKILECANLFETEQNKATDCLNEMGPTNPGGSTANTGFGGALIGAAFATDSLLSARPASGVEYVSNLASRFHLVPEAYAQGFGFKSIEPIQKLWKAFRNMSYALLVIVILAMAFMIMFRVKISPQIVISVQSALPRLVGILILITFSYAIAGFLIDLSYLIIGLFVMFAKAQGLVGGASAIEIAQTAWGNYGVLALPMTTLIILIVLPLLILAVLLYAATPIAAALTIELGAIGGGLTLLGGTILLVIFVFLLVQILRTLWALLKAFITIILLIIFGPLLIMFGGFSPTIGGFGVWFKNLASNIAVFPTIALMAFIAHLIYWSFPHFIYDLLRPTWVNIFKIQGSVPSEATFSLPIFTTGAFLTPLLAALAIMLIMPSAAELIKSIISGQPFNFGQALGQAVAAPQGALSNRVEKYEAGRRKEMQEGYAPTLISRVLDSTGVIKLPK